MPLRRPPAAVVRVRLSHAFLRLEEFEPPWLLLKQEPWRLEFLKAEEGVGEADANNRRRRAAKGHAKEEREERAELAPFGEDYGSGGLNRAEIDLFDDDGL